MRWWLAAVLLLWSSNAVAQEADLRVDAGPIYSVDGPVRVTIAVANDGPDDVFDVDIVAQFDPTTATASQLETGCSNSAAGVVCSFTQLDTPVLASGEELVVEFILTPQPDAPDVQVSVSSTTADPDESNNDDTVALFAATTVDLSIDERGIDAGRRKTLVFSVTNDGPDEAAGVRASGTVTVDFGQDFDRNSAEALTGMASTGAAVCGRQVPDSSGVFQRWTFPVSCSIENLSVGDTVEFEFWFDEAANAQFRLEAHSENLDTRPANDTTDGDFRNSPIEVVEQDSTDEGCCATTGRRVSSGWALLGAAIVAALRRRRR